MLMLKALILIFPFIFIVFFYYFLYQLILEIEALAIRLVWSCGIVTLSLVDLRVLEHLSFQVVGLRIHDILIGLRSVFALIIHIHF